MNTNQKRAAAAFAGLFTAGILMANPVFAGEKEKAACKSTGGCKGKSEMQNAKKKPMDAAKTSLVKEKHACKGLNSCKGNGGDGKNACKGKGSCATDGSMKKMK
jgi:hypothetical protein